MKSLASPRRRIVLAVLAALLVSASSATAWQTDPPAAFTKLSPANGATGVELSYVTLQWQPSAGASWGYEYCIDMVDDGACTAPPATFPWVLVGSALTALVRV